MEFVLVDLDHGIVPGSPHPRRWLTLILSSSLEEQFFELDIAVGVGKKLQALPHTKRRDDPRSSSRLQRRHS